ncbi:MAG: LON peptidase substrate-binding domain-containing protein [Nitrospiria bacterium]
MKTSIYPKIIPLFPLPNLVFFPKTYLPLHIFEPRYREMVQDAEKEGQIIGMVMLKDGWEENYYGNPEICLEGCAGELTTVQPLEDGRFNILLKGLFRFSVKDQFFDKNYREAFVEPFAQDRAAGSLPLKLKKDLNTLLKKRIDWVKGDNSLLSFLNPEIDDETLIHGLSYRLPFSPLEKQFLLESEDLVQQAKRLTDLIQFQTSEPNPSSS